MIKEDSANHRAHMRVRMRMVAPPMYVNTNNLDESVIEVYNNTWCKNDYAGTIVDGKKFKFFPMLSADAPLVDHSGR